MRLKTLLTLTVLGLCLLAAGQDNVRKVRVRLKDVARLKGDEQYTLTGYGVVVGLNNTGDSDESLIQRTIANIMQNFNVIVNEDDIKAQNTAVVMVTAMVKGPAHKGDMIEASVSAVGDSSSLLGGELLLTPILGADAEVWGVAQGPVTTGGFFFGTGGDGGNTKTKNHPTSGILTNGIKLLRDVDVGIKDRDVLTYYLLQPDYTTAVNCAGSVNKKYFGSAIALDSATIKIRVPKNFKEEDRVAAFISDVSQVYFDTDSKARVVFNEKTGTIVIGAEVRISTCAVSHGNLYVDVKDVMGVSQPSPFTRAEAPNANGDGIKTQVINDVTTTVEEQKSRVFEIPNTTTVGELVKVLNSLGVTSRDIMVIFHALRAAGALHADLESI